MKLTFIIFISSSIIQNILIESFIFTLTIWYVKKISFQLANIVAGYTGLVKSLNEELVTELINKDELTAEQDNMLETISELTDNLLWYLTSKELRD